MTGVSRQMGSRALLAFVFVIAGRTLFCRAEPVRAMTFNVRYSTADDGSNRWEKRRGILLDVIREFDPDVLGLQEALQDQVDAIGAALPGHACVGVGREANGGGEYSAVFYRRGRFDLLAADTFWLSDMPELAGSHTWGNELPRVCTWVRLVERADGRRFAVFNTHWDHQSQRARVASGALMAARVAARIAAGDPTLVIGDFNAAADNPAIAALTQQDELVRDTFRIVHPDERSVGTFHGFSGRAGTAKLDAVFASSEWRVRDAAIVRTERNGAFPSDHFPVTAIIELAPPESSPK